MTLSINGKTYEAGELIAYVKKIEKENTELQKKIRCECTRCMYSDSPCIRSDYGVEKDEDVCPNYKNVFVAYTQLKEENAELKEKFLTVKKDDVRKAKLNDCKTYEEKVEYLRQVTNYALFNDDISVMLWCFCQRGEIDTDQLTKAKELLERFLGLGNLWDLDCKDYFPLRKEVEQFLNDEVEK